MNSTILYEQAIAQKLDSLPVPDMADSIWSRIEMELNTPVAPNNKPTPTKPNNAIWYGLIGTVILTVAIILYYNSQKSTPTLPAPPIPAPTEKAIPVTDSVATPKQTVSPNTPVPMPAPAKKDANANIAPVSRIDFDTVDKVNTTPAQPDSAVLNGNKLPALQANPLQTNTPTTKPKGVKGITENDYRVLSSKKDSVKKGN